MCSSYLQSYTRALSLMLEVICNLCKQSLFGKKQSLFWLFLDNAEDPFVVVDGQIVRECSISTLRAPIYAQIPICGHS